MRERVLHAFGAEPLHDRFAPVVRQPQLRLDGIADAVPAIPGVAFGLRSLSLDLGARRRVTKTTYKRVRVNRDGRRVTVRRKVTRRVTYNLLRNPKTCTTAAWSVRLTVGVAGANRARDISVPCAPR